VLRELDSALRLPAEGVTIPALLAGTIGSDARAVAAALLPCTLRMRPTAICS